MHITGHMRTSLLVFATILPIGCKLSAGFWDDAVVVEKEADVRELSAERHKVCIGRSAPATIISMVASLEHVTSVIAQARVEDEQAIELLSMRSLVHLCLNAQPVTDKAIKHASDHPSLERLELYNCSLISEKGVQMLGLMPRLSYLDIGKVEVTPAALESLALSKTLSHLNVSETQAGVHLRTLRRAGKLTELILAGCQGISIDALNELLAGVALVALNLSATGLTSAHLDVLARNESIQNLDISWNQDLVSKAPFAAVKMPLKRIDASHCVGMPIEPMLLNLQSCSGLEAIVLNGTMISDENIRLLEGFKRLRELRLSQCKQLTQTSGAVLAEVTTRLRVLDVSFSGVVTGGELLAQVTNWKELEELNIRGLRGRSSEEYIAITYLRRLQALWIDGSSLEDAVVLSLGALPELRLLNLGEAPNITADLISKIVAFHGEDNLEVEYWK